MTQLLTLPQMLQVISQPNLIERLQIMTIADLTTDITGDLTTKPDQKVADNDTIADPTTGVTSDLTTKPDQKVADNDTTADPSTGVTSDLTTKPDQKVADT